MYARLLRAAAAALVAGMLLAPKAGAEFRVESLDNDFPGEIKNAKGDGKRLVIMFHQAGCPYCDKMRTRVFPDPKVDTYYSKNFVMIESNIKGNLDVVTPDGKKMNEVEMAKKYRIRATPVFLYLDPDGSEALRLTGFLDADLFIRAGSYVVDGIRKKPEKISFYRYLKGQN
ncbi:MAG: thioredoxin family protein [Rhodospirillaceae bacterium]